MLGHLPLARGTAHADVLDRPSEPGKLVPLEVCHRDQNVGPDDLGPDVDLGKMSAVDRHGCFGVPPEAVCNHQGGVDNRKGEPVSNRGGQVVNRIASGARIQRVGIGQKGESPAAPHGRHHLPNEDRPYERRISSLAEMELDRAQVPLCHDPGDAGRIHQPLEFCRKVLLDGGTKIDEVHLACMRPP